MSIHEEDGFACLRLDPQVIAILTAWVDRDIEGLKQGWDGLTPLELFFSLLHLWECAINVGEELGGPPVREVLAGMGLSLAKCIEKDWR